MRTVATALPEVVRLETRVFRDERGHFRESWSQDRYAELGIPRRFVQDNVSWSRHGVLRGLHLQEDPHAQGTLVSVLQGMIWDVAVDVRPESEHFGRWTGELLSAEQGHQLYVPPGFAHGFAVVSPDALVSYKCTEAYDPASERTLIWNDPALAIDWPVREPILSDRDLLGLPLAELRPGCGRRAPALRRAG